jgi:hypothetical protein
MARRWLTNQIALRQKTQQLEQQVTEQREQADVYQTAGEFMHLAPEFPNTPEAVEALTRVMDGNNLDYTPENLAMAHGWAVKNKMYQPLPQELASVANGGSTSSYSRSAAPPPAPPGGNTLAYQRGAVDPWDPNLKLDDLRKQALDAKLSGQEQSVNIYRR